MAANQPKQILFVTERYIKSHEPSLHHFAMWCSIHSQFQIDLDVLACQKYILSSFRPWINQSG